MKCPNCGAEIENAKTCEFCGSQITAEMQKELEQVNKKGCPKCGSTNVSFRRENQGEVRGKNSKQVIHRTVGVCKDCGETWFADPETKKRKTWLWVLGWIFIFPLPLTIILLRKKEMNKILKYSIIAVAWILYLGIGISGNKNAEPANTAIDSNTNNSVSVTETESSEETTSKPDSPAGITIVLGTQGEYGTIRKVDVGTEFEREVIEYHIPEGEYTVLNKSDKSAVQVSVYKNGWTKNDAGYDEPVGVVGKPIVLFAGQTGEITVEKDSYVKLPDGTIGVELLFTPK